MNREELAWAAGFFDGEGHVGPSSTPSQLQLHVGQVDRRALDRFAAVVGVGRVFGPYKLLRSRQLLFRYAAPSFAQAQAVIAMLWPWLGPVKREQYIEAFKAAQPHLRRSQRRPFPDLCAKGHTLPAPIVTGRVRCRACLRRLSETQRVAHALLVAV